MSEARLLEILSELDKKSRKGSGMSWTDRLVGLAIIAALHTLAPSSEHGLLQRLEKDFAVLGVNVSTAQDSIKDHETRIRALEYEQASKR